MLLIYLLFWVRRALIPTHHEERRSHVFSQHMQAFLLVTYLVLPSVSQVLQSRNIHQHLHSLLPPSPYIFLRLLSSIHADTNPFQSSSSKFHFTFFRLNYPIMYEICLPT